MNNAKTFRQLFEATLEVEINDIKEFKNTKKINGYYLELSGYSWTQSSETSGYDDDCVTFDYTLKGPGVAKNFFNGTWTNMGYDIDGYVQENDALDEFFLNFKKKIPGYSENDSFERTDKPTKLESVLNFFGAFKSTKSTNKKDFITTDEEDFEPIPMSSANILDVYLIK